jgi:hypothetical protein
MKTSMRLAAAIVGTSNEVTGAIAVNLAAIAGAETRAQFPRR